jgi:hypothetical protein
MEEAVEGGRGRWSTAIALSFVVLVLSIFDALALVVLPLAILIVALPAEKRARWVAVGIALWLLAFLFSGGELAMLSRGWALMLGALFLVLTLARPVWDVTTRALLATAIGVVLGGVALAISGQADELDANVRQHLTTVSTLTLGDLQSRMPDSPWLAELRTATEQIADLQADLFVAMLALQSVAALALVAWWIRRIGRSDSEAFVLGRLREFRFNDQLIWILIAGVVALLLPLNSLGERIAINTLVFMAAIYALRGLAVFVFLATESKSVPTMVLGALAFVFLYPIALTAALMMGVGDTWLDVRRRVAAATPT